MTNAFSALCQRGALGSLELPAPLIGQLVDHHGVEAASAALRLDAWGFEVIGILGFGIPILTLETDFSSFLCLRHELPLASLSIWHRPTHRCVRTSYA